MNTPSHEGLPASHDFGGIPVTSLEVGDAPGLPALAAPRPELTLTLRVLRNEQVFPYLRYFVGQTVGGVTVTPEMAGLDPKVVDAGSRQSYLKEIEAPEPQAPRLPLRTRFENLSTVDHSLLTDLEVFLTDPGFVAGSLAGAITLADADVVDVAPLAIEASPPERTPEEWGGWPGTDAVQQ